MGTVTELVVLTPPPAVKGALRTKRTRPEPDYFSGFAMSASRWLPAAAAVARAHRQSHRAISLLALNGLRFLEALVPTSGLLASKAAMAPLTVLRKGGKVVAVPLEQRTARASNPAIGEPLGARTFVPAKGRRLDRYRRRAHSAPGRAPRQHR